MRLGDCGKTELCVFVCVCVCVRARAPYGVTTEHHNHNLCELTCFQGTAAPLTPTCQHLGSWIAEQTNSFFQEYLNRLISFCRFA
jgi:hypothetical protein